MTEGANTVNRTSTALRLGYSADARVLIINADDFGMCPDQNEATIEGLTHRAFTSSTILVTCPWFEEAAEFARTHREADFHFFMSGRTRPLLKDEGIELAGYRKLRGAMRGGKVNC